ncbi:bf2446fe-2503-45dc-b20a-2c20dca5ea6b [Sclerotinia trifoliorum]|uniref:Bf2446fe-2503-45dc-b20a-2c20dca5ea6b n=1 Tax=Sclerotinia trifoliorum TaxID=28548 RepID=A0A8H2VKY7_9HELO|nr:bf2446fe-2503-45dc-b20a-2c20dca5ea6b [Sclerotinia trifoliorum]
MIAKLVSDQNIKPAYTKEKATRLYEICYRKYSRGYVRASTEKTFYEADQCFWRQFWPAEEFPGKKTGISRMKKDGKAVDKDETIAVQINQGSNQAESRKRQEEITESLWSQPLSKPEEPPKIIKSRERSRSRHNIVDRNRPNTTNDKRAIDWEILTIQRRIEHQRQLKQNLLNKRARAKKAARELTKLASEASTMRDHPAKIQKNLEGALTISSTTNLQQASPKSDVAATNLHKEGPNSCRKSRHSSESVQLPVEPSSGRLQTLDEMIREEREIAMQLSITHESTLDTEENRSIRQSRDGLEVANGVNGASDEQRRFCLIL